MKVPQLQLAGTPYEMGKAHGQAMAAQIATYARERVALAGERAWTGRDAGKQEVLALAAACLEKHAEYSPDLMEELAGVAAGSQVSAEELMVAGGFTDFVDTVAGTVSGDARGSLENETDDCTAFLVPASRMVSDDGSRPGGALAQTWDMHEGSAEQLVLLHGRPNNAPDFTIYSTAGCLGMIGMNESGLSVGINNLMAADGRVGVTWPFAVRAMLEQETVAAALSVLLATPLAGGHNYLLLDAQGNGVNVEAMPTRTHVTRLEEATLVHANHCLYADTKAVERAREELSQANSEARQADAERLLDRPRVSVADLRAVTADRASICRVGVAPSFVGTCGAVVMLPASRELWIVGGRPSEGEFQRYEVAAMPA